MKPQPVCISIAQKMYGAFELPEGLRNELELTNMLIKRVKPKGELRSTQVIATIIRDWERHQRSREVTG